MSSVSSYTHTQDTPSDSWTINHNLNTLAPIIDTFIEVEGVVTKILSSSVVVVDANNVTVTWTSPRTGIAAIR